MYKMRKNLSSDFLQLLNLITTRKEKLTSSNCITNCITKLSQLTLILLFKISLEYILKLMKKIFARDLII